MASGADHLTENPLSSRRYRLVILVWFAAGLVLAGCGRMDVVPTLSAAPASSATPEASSTPAPEATVTPTSRPASTLGVDETKLHGLHIRMWYSGPQALQEAMNVEAQQFNAGNPQEIWVEPTYFGSFDELSAQAQAASDEQRPDVALNYSALAAGWVPDLIRPVDLGPYLDDPVWGMSAADRADFPAGMIPAAGGAISGFPGYLTDNLLYYNQSWANALGFSQPPKTPDEFRTQACAAAKENQASKKADKTGTGGWIASQDAAAVLSWIAAFGGGDPSASGAQQRFNGAPSEKAFTYLKSLFDQGCAWVARNPDPTGYFVNRQALFYSGRSADISGLEEAVTAAKSTDRWTVLPYPAEDGRGVVYGDGPKYYLLSSTPERQLAGWLFIRAISLAEPEARLSAGSGVLPVRLSARVELAEPLQKHPQWAEAYADLATMRVLPGEAPWVTVRPVLEDAAGQLYQATTKPAQIRSILDMLDQTIQEVGTQTP
jgi:multiple sugar transport system substrate-binding protein